MATAAPPWPAVRPRASVTGGRRGWRADGDSSAPRPLAPRSSVSPPAVAAFGTNIAAGTE